MKSFIRKFAPRSRKVFRAQIRLFRSRRPHKGPVVSKKADLAHEVFTRSKVVRKKGGESRAKITRVSQTVQCIGSRLVKCLENLGGESRGDEFGEVFEGGGGDAGD